MRYLLSLALAPLVALSVAGCATTPTAPGYTVARASGGLNCRRLAQPGDTKIQIYCNRARLDVWERAAARDVARSSGQTSSDISCRRLVRLADAPIQRFCGDAAHWNEFDTWAVSAGVTCRWTRGALGTTPQEACLNPAQWLSFESNRSRNRSNVANAGANWPGSGVAQPSAGSGFGYATTFGPFGCCDH